LHVHFQIGLGTSAGDGPRETSDVFRIVHREGEGSPGIEHALDVDDVREPVELACREVRDHPAPPDRAQDLREKQRMKRGLSTADRDLEDLLFCQRPEDLVEILPLGMSPSSGAPSVAEPTSFVAVVGDG
jgi:hypothetical protein